ncbi:unnamed protein product [Diplocarpon coronariae]|uniref:Uncharacterized protein n=1 Tax=Diplocarpon coronariae TaxID=2795749 RepID=A0A218YYH8_9HELO|nr:hypothetical protein B2J93_761 [Marssonina coronariae]
MNLQSGRAAGSHPPSLSRCRRDAPVTTGTTWVTLCEMNGYLPVGSGFGAEVTKRPRAASSQLQPGGFLKQTVGPAHVPQGSQVRLGLGQQRVLQASS